MRTGAEYREGLLGLKNNVHMGGERVSRDDFRIQLGANVMAMTFDAAFDPELVDLCTATSHLTGKKVNRYTHIHQSPDDLLKKQEMNRVLTQRCGTCIQRCMGVDAANALSIVTYDIGQATGNTRYHENFLNWLKNVQDNDLACNCSQTDVKGDRSKRPHQQVDPDLYVRVVEKRKDGIVVRGAKVHNSHAPYVDEIICIPTRALTKEESDWAVAFAVPADWEGVHLIVRPSFVRQRKHMAAPFTEQAGGDSWTVYDNVFVPWERVFMCGEWEFGGALAGGFANYHRHSYTGCKPAVTDVFMGATALVADYNGIGNAPHVRDDLAELIATAELVYGAGIASAIQGKRAPSGTFVPNVIYTNAGRYHAGVSIYHEYETLAAIAGGLPATLPMEEDWFNPETKEYLEKYVMRNPAIPAADQHKLFRFISDLSCSGLGAMLQYAGIHGGGSPIMEKITIRANYDLEARKDMVRRLAGISEG